MAAEYQRIRARSREDPGTAGDEGEQNWAELSPSLAASGTEELKAGVELGAMVQGPRADIAKHTPAAGLLERIELQRQALIVREHARAADQVPAGGPPAPGAAASVGGLRLLGETHVVDRLRSLGRDHCGLRRS
jgi:hypothetical protein